MTSHWIDERGRAAFDEQGRVRHLDGAIFDITAQKLAKDALRIAEEKYRSIFENALEGIFQASPEGHLISVNPAMARIFGYDSPENMIAQSTDIQKQLFLDSAARNNFFQDIETEGQVSNEESLQRQLAELKIEIDQQKRQKDVNSITESGYFQQIQSEIADLDLDEFWNNQT